MGQAQQLAIADPVKAGWLKGQLAEKYKDQTSAENEYRTAIQTSHGAAGAWLNLASFYRRVSRLDAMEDAIGHASSAPINQPQVLIECAQMLLRSNRNLPEATELLRRCPGVKVVILSRRVQIWKPLPHSRHIIFWAPRSSSKVINRRRLWSIVLRFPWREALPLLKARLTA